MTLDALTVLVDFLAVWRLARLVARDDFPPIKRARDWLLRRWPSDDAQFVEDDVVTASNPDDPDGMPLTGAIRGTGVPVEWNFAEGAYMPVRGHWLGKLITCIWCASIWVGFGAAALRHGAPWEAGWWPWIAWVLAASGTAALIDKLDRW